MNTEPSGAELPALVKALLFFTGRVESIENGIARITLLNEGTGERLEAHCAAEVLTKEGIGSGDEFRCEVIPQSFASSLKFTRLEPKSLSAEEFAGIAKEVDSKLGL